MPINYRNRLKYSHLVCFLFLFIKVFLSKILNALRLKKIVPSAVTKCQSFASILQKSLIMKKTITALVVLFAIIGNVQAPAATKMTALPDSIASESPDSTAINYLLDNVTVTAQRPLIYGAQNEAYKGERGLKTPKAVYLQRVARVEAMRAPQNETFT